MQWDERNQKSWNLCGIYYYIVDISWKTYEKNGVETKIDNYEILWLNRKHLEEGENDKHFSMTTGK